MFNESREEDAGDGRQAKFPVKGCSRKNLKVSEKSGKMQFSR